ncbi:MAG: response regulator [Elusimicrobiota bacterium]
MMATKVLVVDDEEDYRTIVKTVLEDAGYEVRLAEGGEQGLSAVEEYQPEMILLDWTMPEQEGPSFVQKVRSSGARKDVPVIVLTEQEFPDQEPDDLPSDVDDFIGKPFERGDLLTRLQAMLWRVPT